MSSILVEALDLIIAERLVDTEVSTRRYSGKLRNTNNRAQGAESGFGAFSKVKPHRTNPHLMRKHNHRKLGSRQLVPEDGFNVFIDYLVKGDYMDNPHFPKVYKMEKIEDDHGSHIHTYDTEALVAAEALSDEELAAVAHSHFRMEEGDTANLTQMANALKACINDPSRTRTLIKLPDLAEAIAVVVKIQKASNAELDLHQGNFMFRRGRTGMTLVINDPFSGVDTDDEDNY